jgi:stearoyl-CoA desaturase (delta-9 desaturase)
MEHNEYTHHSRLGIGILFLFNIIIFGWLGALIWGIQMIWIPFWAAGVINGLAHWWGYRNGETRDRSRYLVPIGIVIGVEELHNNHHLDPASAKLSLKPWEFDIGWFYIRTLSLLGLARLR